MKASNVKGHCQACGRVHVVLDGKGIMSNHGYKVRAGYFQGICIGNGYLPLEESRSHLDYVVSYLRREALMHDVKAERLESGADLPEQVICRSEPYGSVMYHSRYHDDVDLRGKAMMSPWHQGSVMEQKYQLEADIAHHKSEAGFARSHANSLVSLAARVHGQPLIDRAAEEMVKREKAVAKKAPIEGAYRTKAAQKEALEALNREYEKQRKIIQNHYLAQPDRNSSAEVESVYYALPYQLNHFRSKHAYLIRKVYPVMDPAVSAIEALVIMREVVKARPVVKS
jgi:hypothetical protein